MPVAPQLFRNMAESIPICITPEITLHIHVRWLLVRFSRSWETFRMLSCITYTVIPFVPLFDGLCCFSLFLSMVLAFVFLHT